MKTVIHLALHTVAVAVAAFLTGVSVESWFVALAVAIVLGILNTFLRPVIIFLTLPATILTLGLFALVINAGIILLASWIVPGFFVPSFLAALYFGIALFLINSFFDIFKD